MIDINVTILHHGNINAEGAFSLTKKMSFPSIPFVGATLELELGGEVLIKEVESVLFSENSSDIELFLESEFNLLFPGADQRIARYQDFGWEKELIDPELIVGNDCNIVGKKKIHFLYSLKSHPDVAAVEIGGCAGFVALSELRKIVKEGIQDKYDNSKSLVPTTAAGHTDISDEDIICLTFNVSGSLKTHMSRVQAKQFLKDAKRALVLHE